MGSTSPISVLMFGWEFPPHISGGLGTACQGIVTGLVQNGIAVTMVVPKTFGNEKGDRFRLMDAGKIAVTKNPGDQEIVGKMLRYFEINSPIVPYLNPEEYEAYQKQHADISSITGTGDRETTTYNFSGQYGKDLIIQVHNYALVAGEIARKVEFDIIHAHDWHSFPAGIMAKKVSNKPLVVHIHSTEFDRSGENINQQVYDMEKLAMEEADKVITVSEFTRQILISRYHIPADKIKTVHNAVEPLKTKTYGEKQIQSNKKTITYLGRVTFQKGPEYFIEAAAKVLKKDSRFRFVMAGNGNLLNKMIDLTARLRISRHFHFTGFLKGEEVNRLLSQSNAYVMPSVSEPFGISPLEAIQNGVPVILSKQSGVQEILNHVIKVDFWDTDAMANSIYGIGAYRGLPKTLIKGSKLELGTISWNRQSEKIKAVYSDMLNYSNSLKIPAL